MVSLKGLIVAIKSDLSRADRAEEYYARAGKKLKEAKEELRRRDAIGEWKVFVKDNFNLGQTRADELIRIADNKTTVTKLRAEKAQRVAKSKSKLKVKAQSASSARGAPRASDPIQEGCGEECTNDEERWQRSLSSLAGDAISLEAFWTREFGAEWKNFEVPSSLVTLAKQAAKSWTDLAAKLANKQE